jgi:hypothetical protein
VLEQIHCRSALEREAWLQRQQRQDLHQQTYPIGVAPILVTDGAKVYRAFARSAGIRHEAVNLRAGVRTRGPYHLQNMNGYHSRFKRWLLRFRGVASRYLTNYLGWRHSLDTARHPTPQQLLHGALRSSGRK